MLLSCNSISAWFNLNFFKSISRIKTIFKNSKSTLKIVSVPSCYEASVISHSSIFHVTVDFLLRSISRVHPLLIQKQTKEAVEKSTALTFQSFKYISTYISGRYQLWKSHEKALHNTSPLRVYLKFLNHIFLLPFFLFKFSRLSLSHIALHEVAEENNDAELTSFLFHLCTKSFWVWLKGLITRGLTELTDYYFTC